MNADGAHAGEVPSRVCCVTVACVDVNYVLVAKAALYKKLAPLSILGPPDDD